jgi:Xaa-Pro dipeptidase
MITTTQAEVYLSRQKKVIEKIGQNRLQGLLVVPGASMYYFTGLTFHLSERPVLLIFSAEGSLTIIAPDFEKIKIEGLSFPLSAALYGENPDTWVSVFSHALQQTGISRGRVAVEPTGLRFLEIDLLQKAGIEADLVSAEEFLAGLRMQKDAQELSYMQRAVEIAQNALQATLPLIKIGMRESDLAGELTLQLLRSGSDVLLPFSPIISSGPNGANPHAFPSDRPLSTGDLLVIDWGASFQHYFSDLTRTFALGKVEPEFVCISEIVNEANTAAGEKAAPGIPSAEVDAAARRVIERAGYADFFTHRTGHGLGLEGHEPPYIRGDNRLLLFPGMTFTIEPGIYLPGRGGVRIEDNVVITEGGSECLSSLPRQLITID